MSVECFLVMHGISGIIDLPREVGSSSERLMWDVCLQLEEPEHPHSPMMSDSNFWLVLALKFFVLSADSFVVGS